MQTNVVYDICARGARKFFRSGRNRHVEVGEIGTRAAGKNGHKSVKYRENLDTAAYLWYNYITWIPWNDRGAANNSSVQNGRGGRTRKGTPPKKRVRPGARFLGRRRRCAGLSPLWWSAITLANKAVCACVSVKAETRVFLFACLSPMWKERARRRTQYVYSLKEHREERT